MDLAPIFESLQQKIRPEALDAIRQLIRAAPDNRLSRINPLRFGGEHGLTDREAIGTFVRVTHSGLFDLDWSVLCSHCAGTLCSARALQDITEDDYACALCATHNAPVLDQNVEVTFTVSPRVRRIAAHSPDGLPFWDFAQQVCWSSGIELPSDVATLMGGVVLDTVVLPGQDSARRMLALDSGTIVVFDLVSHTAQFLNAEGLACETPQEISIEIGGHHGQRPAINLRPGPVEILLRNVAPRRALPAVLRIGEGLSNLVSRRVPFLTAKRLLTDQTFRDVYRTDFLNIDQRFKITNLTFLFTDLKGSTELYEKIGDLAAYDLIQMHFRVLSGIVAERSGAIVKTIGDSVMATFSTPKDGLEAALRMRKAMDELNERNLRGDIILKIGLHAGPCLAVSVNERQDYFGQTVNIAARLQSLAKARSVLTTKAVIADEACRALASTEKLSLRRDRSALRGIQDKMETYEIA